LGNEMENAVILFNIDADETGQRVMIFLPVEGSYEVVLTSDQAPTEEKSVIRYYSPSFTLVLDSLSPGVGVEHRIRLEPQHATVTYTSSQDGSINASVILPSSNEDRKLIFSNVDAFEGMNISFTKSGEDVVLSQGSPAEIRYDLEAVFWDANGEYKASLKEGVLPGGKNLRLGTSRTEIGDEPILQMDTDNDGVFDDVIPMKKETGFDLEYLSELTQGNNAGLLIIFVGTLTLLVGVGGLFILRRKEH